ncbi:hypothetical protein BGX26_002613 [Mortierella sp. AD094]|nr:hypothetical protein BGX26_002613 [Mortierella sp. AD094]
MEGIFRLHDTRKRKGRQQDSTPASQCAEDIIEGYDEFLRAAGLAFPDDLDNYLDGELGGSCSLLASGSETSFKSGSTGSHKRVSPEAQES